jgi:predicted 3-demethylubiquinone-9 3-methyltransferase (glyoxalase superfamily)
MCCAPIRSAPEPPHANGKLSHACLSIDGSSVLLIEFTLNGQRCRARNGEPLFHFSDAVAFSVRCTDQAEVDRYWDALTADGGAPGPCGWLKDRFGVSWQIMQQVRGRPTQGTLEQIGRTMAAPMCMPRLDVAALEAAYAGDAAD